MTVRFTMTVVCLEVKRLIVDETIQNLKDAGRLQDEPKLVGYRHHLWRSAPSKIVEEWETSKRLLQ